ANVVAIPNIIRQGRCTLVATIQMYKILALNCLISAYSLSVLYLDGIKFGDGQVTVSGMLMSVCFLSISRAKTVEQLSKERPQNNIWNWYIIPSVLGQFAVHIATLIYISEFVHKFEEKKDRSQIDLEGEFEPSLLNSAIYLLQLIQQISTFAINYQGRPFRESIRENKGMFYGIVLVTAVAFSCATEFVPEINEQLKLVPFTTEFKVKMCITMVVDYVGCWVIEKVLKMAFSDYKPKDIAVRRPDQLEKEAARAKEENEKKLKEIERKADWCHVLPRAWAQGGRMTRSLFPFVAPSDSSSFVIAIRTFCLGASAFFHEYAFFLQQHRIRLLIASYTSHCTGSSALGKDMDLGGDLSEKLSGLNPEDSTEETSSRDGSLQNVIDGKGQQTSDQALDGQTAEASGHDPLTLASKLFIAPSFGKCTYRYGTSISGCFVGVTFEDCVLEDMTITDCCMENVTFRDCNFKKVTWAELHLCDLVFDNCTFEDHLWRGRSLHDTSIQGTFRGETSLSDKAPPETNMAIWVEQQRQAFIAASIGDEAYARLVQAELNGDEDFEPVAQQSAGRDVPSGQASTAQSSPHGRLQSEKVIQSRRFNDWNSPLWKSPRVHSKYPKVKPNKTAKDLDNDVVAVSKRSVDISLANLGQQAPRPVKDADLPVREEKLCARNEKQSDAFQEGQTGSKKCENIQSVTNGNPGFATSTASGSPSTDSTVIEKKPTGMYGLPPHLRKKKAQ
ncbi:putative cation transporting ATPase, partial [Hortaea werneckii]